MPHYRKTKNQKLYDLHTARVNASKVCGFCLLDGNSDQVITVTKNFKIVKNIFPYDNWDSRQVLDHLMIVPIKHTDTLSELGEEASVEYVKLVSAYESSGYDVFARSPHSTIKSVAHQHTHLIKTGGKRYKTLIHISKPYISITL